MASIETAVIHAEVIRYRKGRAHRSARARPEQQGQRSDAGAGAVPCPSPPTAVQEPAGEDHAHTDEDEVGDLDPATITRLNALIGWRTGSKPSRVQACRP
jgi:hypothetical protein